MGAHYCNNDFDNRQIDKINRSSKENERKWGNFVEGQTCSEIGEVNKE